MAAYTLTQSPDATIVRRNSDAAEFVLDERSPEYSAYLAWLTAGGTPEIVTIHHPGSEDAVPWATREW